MPQPTVNKPAGDTAGNGAATEPKTTEPKTLTERLFEQINAIPEDEREIPEVQFMRACNLEHQKAEVGKQINANRQFLRIMDDTDTLNDDLSEWLETFYATKNDGENRSKDEVQVTRKNHEAAARVVAAALKAAQS